MTQEEQNITFYAFRYALGRKTYVVSEVVAYLNNNWFKLDSVIRKQIQNEIKEAIEKDEAGMEVDKKDWKKVLEWRDF